MKVLALDTTTKAGSAALVENDRIVDEREGNGALTHALRMPAEILSLADANGWRLADVDLFAVASGPGSFTGLRIGIATIQGLALVHGRRIVAVPVLDALAHTAAANVREGATIAAWMDAQRGDVFSSLYRVESAPRTGLAALAVVDGPTVETPAATLARWREMGESPAVYIGDASILYASEIAAASSVVRPLSLPLPLLAGVIGRLAAARAMEALEPQSVRPLYVRRPAVELQRDKKRSSN